MPIVLSHEEVARIIAHIEGRKRLIIELLYGSGLCIKECLRLRVQDVDTTRYALSVLMTRPIKIGHLIKPLAAYFSTTKITLATVPKRRDNEQGIGPSLPGALGRKYSNA